MSDQSDDDEILTPEVVDEGAPEPQSQRSRTPGRADRRPIWALVAGLGSILSMVLVPLFAPVFAVVGIVLGRRVLRELDPNDEANRQPRNRAKMGLVGGITTLVVFVLLLTYVAFIYDPPDPLGPDFVDDKASSEPAG